MRSWYSYILHEHVPDVMAGVLVILIAYFVLPKRFKEWKPFSVFVLLPGLISASFPDAAYFFSYVISKGTVKGVLLPYSKNMVYYMFHSFPSLIIVPTVMLFSFLFWKYVMQKEFPKKWELVTLIVSFLSVFLHVWIVDPLGF